MADIGDERVQRALHAILAGDPDDLRAAMDADPEIAGIRWSDNTLLEWVTQPPHDINPAIVEVLISSNSPLDRALNLAACWNLPDLCQQLLAAGADPSVLAEEGVTPLESAAMHGSTRSADALTPHGLHRPSLWLAAAAGLTEEVRDRVDPNGRILKDPGPYRPNLADIGHPPGPAPSDEPVEILGEALVFAGANNRPEVVDYFIACGMDINVRPYLNTTALHLAIMFHNPEAVAGLLERGASTDIPDDRHRSNAFGWAEACRNDNPDSQRIIDLLEAAR